MSVLSSPLVHTTGAVLSAIRADAPVVGEQSIGQDKPSPLVAFDIVGPFEQPAAELLRAYAIVRLAHSSARSIVLAELANKASFFPSLE